MASVEIGTQAQALGDTITHGRNLVLAGTRLYAVYNDGTNLTYEYSDDSGATWIGATTIAVSNLRMPSAFYDAVNGRLNFAYANGNNSSGALRFRAITSNVTSGTPGALTTETVIDAAGTNVGVVRPYAFHSPTASNPRYWIIATKLTAATTLETRVWYCAAGSAADTDSNWSTTNFTNLGGNSNTDSAKGGVGIHWTVSGVDKVTFVFSEGSDDVALETVTFDPTAATPTPGSVGTVTGSSVQFPPNFTDGSLISIAAKADYLVVGAGETTSGTWDFFKTVDGTTWTEPSGWTGLTMGRASLALSGSDFYLVHTDSYGALGSTAQTLSYRKITASGDTMGSPTTFSDTAGNGVAVPVDTGTANLYGMYRASTATPYSVRSDLLAITAAQTLLPDADIATTGWTTAPLFSKINDSSDATVITATAS